MRPRNREPASAWRGAQAAATERLTGCGGRVTDGGVALGGCTEHYRVGPLEQPDYSRWETELAYLIG